jgi:hypothetical protein
MTLKQLTSAALDLSGQLEKDIELAALLAKWLEKQVKAKSTNLAALTLLAQTDQGSLRTVLASVPEPAVRSLAKNVDSKNKEISGKSRQDVIDHILALATGRLSPVQSAARTAGPKNPKPTSAARGDILERSKYKKQAA